MTNKVYKTARGKLVDMGSLRLQNENVRAVGNMGVNARGDRIDSEGNIIDPRNQQMQRRIQRQTNVVDCQVYSSSRAAQQASTQQEILTPDETAFIDPMPDLVVSDPTVVDDPTADPTIPAGGLAAAIARSKTVKQELEKTPRQMAQSQGIKKL